jgi:hypothetical protein
MNVTQVVLCSTLAIFIEHGDGTSGPMEDFLLTWFTTLLLATYFYIGFRF